MCHKFAVGIDCDGSTATADNVPRLDSYFPGTRLLYLDIFASWPDTPWSLKCQDRDYQKVKGTGGPAGCGFLGPAWIHRFYQTESRGSTRPTRQPHSALNWERRQKKKKKLNCVSHAWFLWLLNDFLLRLTLKCTLHEFVTGLIVLWADVVASPTQQVQALSAPRARITVHTGLAICWTFCKDNIAVCICPYGSKIQSKKALGFLLGAHSLCASLRASPSGQVSWHLPRWRKNPARHRVQKFLAKQESHSDLHSWQRNTDPPPAFI